MEAAEEAGSNREGPSQSQLTSTNLHKNQEKQIEQDARVNHGNVPTSSVDERLRQARNFLSQEDADSQPEFAKRHRVIKELLRRYARDKAPYDVKLYHEVSVMLHIHKLRMDGQEGQLVTPVDKQLIPTQSTRETLDDMGDGAQHRETNSEPSEPAMAILAGIWGASRADDSFVWTKKFLKFRKDQKSADDRNGSSKAKHPLQSRGIKKAKCEARFRSIVIRLFHYLYYSRDSIRNDNRRNFGDGFADAVDEGGHGILSSVQDQIREVVQYCDEHEWWVNGDLHQYANLDDETIEMLEGRDGENGCVVVATLEDSRLT